MQMVLPQNETTVLRSINETCLNDLSRGECIQARGECIQYSFWSRHLTFGQLKLTWFDVRRLLLCTCVPLRNDRFCSISSHRHPIICRVALSFISIIMALHVIQMKMVLCLYENGSSLYFHRNASLFASKTGWKVFVWTMMIEHRANAINLLANWNEQKTEAIDTLH